MHCISCTLKRKVEKYLLFKQTLKSRFTCLACQHFSFDAKKSLDRERPFSLALRVVSLFLFLSRLAPSVTRVAICVSRVLLDRLQKKERLLVVYQEWSTSIFSQQHQQIIKNKGYENYLIDYQGSENTLILNQILSTILKRNVWKSVWRICMWILGLKGF